MERSTRIYTPEATLAELEEQRRAALANLEGAQLRVEHARAAYDAAGDTKTEKALLDALRDAQVSEERLGRAERLHAAAVDRQESTRRSSIERQLAELRGELAPPALAAASLPLETREAELLIEVARVRLARTELARAYDEKRTRVRVLMQQLSGGRLSDDQEREHDRIQRMHVHSLTVVALLKSLSETLPESLQALVRKLEPSPKDYA